MYGDWNVLDLLNITHIINVTDEYDNFFPNFIQYLQIKELDIPETNLYQYFEDATNFICMKSHHLTSEC